MLRRALLALPWAAPGARAAALVEPTLHIPPPAVALTLDLCPGGFDARLFAGLAEAGIRATCFLTGEWLRRNPGGLAVLLARRDLFAFANHGEHHLLAAPGSAPLFGRLMTELPDLVADGPGIMRLDPLRLRMSSAVTAQSL